MVPEQRYSVAIMNPPDPQLPQEVVVLVPVVVVVLVVVLVVVDVDVAVGVGVPPQLTPSDS
jgi:hypothetical protein